MTQMQRVTGRSTEVFTDEDNLTKVVYHKTVVVAFNEDLVRLNSGGWKTVTTKTRMNQASNQYRLGFAVIQKDGVWAVWHNGVALPFTDGMELRR